MFNFWRYFAGKPTRKEIRIDAGEKRDSVVPIDDETGRISSLLEQSASLERADYERAWREIFDSGRDLIIGQDEYGKVHKERFWELLNAVHLQISGKERPRLMEFGASEFSALYKRFFPHSVLHLSDRPTPADYIGFTETVCRRIAACEAFFALDLETPDFLEKNPGLSGSYDLILFAEVLEHLVVNPVDLMRRLLRMLRPGGSLYLTTPNFFSHRNLLLIQTGENPQQIYPEGDGNWDAHHHYREYCLKELLRFVEQAGGRTIAYYFSACWDADAGLPVDARGNIVLVIKKAL